jgi:cell division protein ZapA (FtsZ GTPase activity inhibitor)
VNPPHTTVTIGNARLTVPVVRDIPTTQRLAAKVTERLRDIEKRSSRIDTVAFALEAAFSFAADLEEEKLARNEEQAEIIAWVSDCVRALDEITAEHAGDREE